MEAKELMSGPAFDCYASNPTRSLVLRIIAFVEDATRHDLLAFQATSYNENNGMAEFRVQARIILRVTGKYILVRGPFHTLSSTYKSYHLRCIGEPSITAPVLEEMVSPLSSAKALCTRWWPSFELLPGYDWGRMGHREYDRIRNTTAAIRDPY